MSVVSVLLTEALSHDGFHYRVGTKARTEAAYPIGSIKGARGRALASHRCGLGSSFGVDEALSQSPSIFKKISQSPFVLPFRMVRQ